jgi:hypothetical protein
LKPGTYIEINSSILDGQVQFATNDKIYLFFCRKALHISDANNKFLSLLFKVPEEYCQMLRDAIEHIHTVMLGDFKDEDSHCEAFKYLFCHYSWYTQYGEKVCIVLISRLLLMRAVKAHGAPKGVHPNNVQHKHHGRVNIKQRVLYQSKDILKSPVKYFILAEAFTDLFEGGKYSFPCYFNSNYFISFSLKVTSLTNMTRSASLLNPSLLEPLPPAYLFGGFILNISACTWVHHDVKDKRLCIVLPMTDFLGSQFCLYETGFSFDLQMGDVLIFPSCDLTHFNLHISGMHATLVLHSDCNSDDWAGDSCSGWAAHVVHHS